MTDVNAANGAVSQRKIRGPNPTVTAPAAFAASASSTEKPPSLPVTMATRLYCPGCSTYRSGAPPPS